MVIRTILRMWCNIVVALEVLGSFLFGKTSNVWEGTLQKLKRIPNSKIQRILRISYDSLPDDHDQSLFLDIACFLISKDKDYTVRILDAVVNSTQHLGLKVS